MNRLGFGRRYRGEAGSISLPVVALLGCLLLIGGALGGAAAALVDHRRAQSAADLGALAGAAALQRGEDACPAADQVATSNGAEVTRCDVEGEDVLLEVTVPGPEILRWRANPSALARAGPVGSATSDPLLSD